jgi:arabinose-5-phosphate isomerase
MALMKKKNFQKEDFAYFHPGGSLGKRLFVKVSDLMRKEGLPIVSSETILKDAIISTSEGKLGTVIFEKEGVIVGVLSDGDLRRALMNDGFDINNSAFKYATKNPSIVYDENMLAVEALGLIEEKKIQLLLVADEQKKLKGILHIHDLVEAGIKK